MNSVKKPLDSPDAASASDRGDEGDVEPLLRAVPLLVLRGALELAEAFRPLLESVQGWGGRGISCVFVACSTLKLSYGHVLSLSYN